MSRHFSACRGGWPGINARSFDLSLLRTVALDASFQGRFRLAEVIKEAKAKNGWIVFLTHDVDETPSPWGCTPQFFESVVSDVSQQGIEILPLNSALAKVVQRNAKDFSGRPSAIPRFPLRFPFSSE
jgi:hypothetical protein